MTDTLRVDLRLPADLAERLRARADHYGAPLAAYIRSVLVDHLDAAERKTARRTPGRPVSEALLNEARALGARAGAEGAGQEEPPARIARNPEAYELFIRTRNETWYQHYGEAFGGAYHPDTLRTPQTSGHSPSPVSHRADLAAAASAAPASPPHHWPQPEDCPWTPEEDLMRYLAWQDGRLSGELERTGERPDAGAFNPYASHTGEPHLAGVWRESFTAAAGYAPDERQ